MKQLPITHVSPETAYVVDDYPYGFRLRTSIRYWVETKKGRGQRFVSQTLNPKTGDWNKPKSSTYYTAVVIGLDEKNHVTLAALHPADLYDEVKVKAFTDAYELDERTKKEIEVGVQFSKRLNERYAAAIAAKEAA